jgi:hypothetical protein
MIARISLYLLASCLAFNSLAQSAEDTVVLTDGSVIRGQIIEYIWQDHVTIKSANGAVFTYPASQIQSVHPVFGADKKSKEKGYFNQTSTGVLVGNAMYGPQVNFTFTSINGYQINRHFAAGAGLGLNFLSDRLYFPVFADARFYLRDSENSPYVSLQGGYLVADGFEHDNYDIWGYNPRRYHGGGMGGLEVGIRNYTKENFGMTFAIGYQFQRLSSTYDEYFWNGMDQVILPVEEVEQLHRLKLMLGIFFH